MEQVANSKGKKWLKKLGMFGFLFFLIKGLIWLIVAAVGMYLTLGD